MEKGTRIIPKTSPSQPYMGSSIYIISNCVRNENLGSDNYNANFRSVEEIEGMKERFKRISRVYMKQSMEERYYADNESSSEDDQDLQSTSTQDRQWSHFVKSTLPSLRQR